MDPARAQRGIRAAWPGARHDARSAVMADKRSQTGVSGLPPFGDARSSYVVIGTAWTALSRRDGQR